MEFDILLLLVIILLNHYTWDNSINECNYDNRNYDIKNPTNTKQNSQYIETYLYDDYHTTPGQWYSDLTTEDFNDEKIATSIKLVCADSINEVQEIKTEVLNQIKADETATKNQIEEIKAQTEIQLKEVQQVLEQKTQEAVKEVEVQLEKTTNPDNLNVEIPATSVNTEEIKAVNEEVKTEIEQIKTDINEVKTEVEEAKAEIKDKIETVNPCNKENCKCEKCQCGEACNCENGCENANCQCKNVQKVLDEANKAAVDGINKLFNLFRKK